MKVSIIFHSVHAHCYNLAKEIKKGVEQVEGVTAEIYRVPEITSSDIIKAMGAEEKIKTFEDVPVASLKAMTEADGVILGAPTYFGTPSASMSAYLNWFGEQWVKGELVGKVGASFTSASEQNGGAETCLHNLNTFFFHQGMIIVSLPTALCYKQMHVEDKPVGGCSYGASVIAGGMNDNDISAEEAAIARFQGRHVAEIVRDLVKGREHK